VTEAEDLQDEVEDAPRPAYGTTRAPRSPRLSRADVFQAADAVLMAGGRVTIERVRNHLGRGSPNTIQEHLDVWWTKLGSRLRDVPGREFPELPDEVAKALQGLWNTALDSAYAAIDGKAATRDAELATREAALTAREAQFVEHSEAAAARVAALEESLALAREQLTATNHRADRLEVLLQTRESETDRLRTRAEALEAEGRELRGKLEAAADAHQAERAKLDERHAANEARWLVEIDRGRQSAKETAKDHERQLKELRAQISQLQTQRDELKRDLQEARTELRTAVSLRAQAEKRLAAVMLKAVKAARAAQSKSAVSRPTSGKRRR
jgi:DNA repair exonuclease SbcCD ATPase subunit